jgi:hypothetical protein
VILDCLGLYLELSAFTLMWICKLIIFYFSHDVLNWILELLVYFRISFLVGSGRTNSLLQNGGVKRTRLLFFYVILISQLGLVKFSGVSLIVQPTVNRFLVFFVNNLSGWMVNLRLESACLHFLLDFYPLFLCKELFVFPWNWQNLLSFSHWSCLCILWSDASLAFNL